MENLIGTLVKYNNFIFKVSSYNKGRDKFLLSRRKSDYENDWVEVKREEIAKLEKV
jgi:hypothetical protein